MSFREVPMVETKEIVRLWLAGLPKKRVAARVMATRTWPPPFTTRRASSQAL